ncbi:hypothetical protein [Streptomyces malaysiensis]|uniref:hypothetical protein n=1 Tax=Streptomyces malaysiensis TaxID=92644 RepID=UPI003675626A
MEQKTCRLVWVSTVKTVSQAGHRRAMSLSASMGSGVWSGDTSVHPGSDGVGLVLVTA